MTFTVDLTHVIRAIEFFGALSSIYLVIWLTWLNGKAYKKLAKEAICEALFELHQPKQAQHRHADEVTDPE